MEKVFTPRFSSKASVYAQYRWEFSSAAIESIFSITRLSHDAVVADIGAGTGKLSRYFLNRTSRLYAVEPDPIMAQLAAQEFNHFPRYFQVRATAEATALPAAMVDLIVVGRAIHWFNPERARAEFLRISRPGGWLAILQVPCTDEQLEQASRAIRTSENGWEISEDKSRREKVPYDAYFGHANYVSQRFPETVTEVFPEFLGRLSSYSNAPGPEHPYYARFREAARRLFEEYSVEGRLTINIATDLNLGRLA